MIRFTLSFLKLIYGFICQAYETTFLLLYEGFSALYKLSGLKHIVRKFQSVEDNIRHPTGFLWAVGLYFALYQTAVLNYQGSVESLNRKVDQISRGVTDHENIRYWLTLLPKVQNTKTLLKPEIWDPILTIKSLIGDEALNSEIIKTLKGVVVSLQTGGKLKNAQLERVNLSDADLWGADLQDADLQDANLRGAILTTTELIGANLRGTNLTGARLIRADLTAADLIGADLTGAKGLDKDQLKLAAILLNKNMLCNGSSIHEKIKRKYELLYKVFGKPTPFKEIQKTMKNTVFPDYLEVKKKGKHGFIVTKKP